ncbi:hypothetical protein GN956_G1741 [Arapaima gigas]
MEVGRSNKPKTEPGKQPLSAAQQEFVRMELQKVRNCSLRTRNRATGMIVGAFVVGLFGYTVYSVKQERVVEEVDEEVRIAIVRGPRTGANS